MLRTVYIAYETAPTGQQEPDHIMPQSTDQGYMTNLSSLKALHRQRSVDDLSLPRVQHFKPGPEHDYLERFGFFQLS